MEDPLHSPKHGRKSSKFSTVKGIIRIPVRRSRDEDNASPPAVTVVGSPVLAQTTGHNRSGSHGGPLDDSRSNHPYGRIGEFGIKPYMSQPMLGLAVRPMDDERRGYEEGEGEGSSASASPDRSPARLDRPALHQHHNRSQSELTGSTRDKRDGQPPTPKKFSPHSISSALRSGTHAGFANLGRKTSRGTFAEGMQDASPDPHTSSFVARAETLSQSNSAPPPPTAFSPARPRSNSVNSVKSLFKRPKTPLDSESNSKGSRLFRRPSKSKLNTAPERSTESRPPVPTRPPPTPPTALSPATSGSSASTAIPSSTLSNTIYSSKLTDVPATISYTSTPTLHLSPSSPNTAISTRMSTDGATRTPSGALAPNSVPRTFAPISPRRTASAAPRLTLPLANHRFSINGMADGSSSASARLSPSIIMRPTPLPLLNLPVLSPLGEPSASEMRPERRVGLKSMPALPHQGSSRGVRGAEEVDDMEDDDEEDDDDDMSHDIDEMPTSRSSMDSERSTDDDDEAEEEEVSHSKASSYETAPSPTSPYYGNTSRPPDKRFSRTPYLPKVDTSGINFDFSSFVTSPALPPSHRLSIHNAKGKAPESSSSSADLVKVEMDPHLGRSSNQGQKTPRASVLGSVGGAPAVGGSRQGEGEASSSSGMDYFFNYQVAAVGSDSLAGSTTSTSRPSFAPRDSTRSFSERTLRSSVLHASSPGHTPKADGFHFSFPDHATPGVGGVPPMPAFPARLSEARLSVNSAALGSSTLYKRASRSLIDVHSLETKEKVDQMIREEENAAEEEERKRKVKALRMSMKVVLKGTPYGKEVKDREPGWTPLLNGDETPREGSRDPMKTPPHSADAVMEGGDSSTGGTSVDAGDKTPVIGIDTAIRDRRISKAPAYDTIVHHPLRRRRSMPTFTATTAPPPYPDFPPHPHGLKKDLKIQPREDEGKEKLPPYSNSIYLQAIMPRKMEFSKPGLQAKDRKWRRVMCVLNGTSFKVYKLPAASGVSVIGEWWESKVGAGNAVEGLGPAAAAYQASMAGQRAVTAARPSPVEETSKKVGESADGGQPVLQRSSPSRHPEQPTQSQPQPQSQPCPPRPHGHHSSHSLGVASKSALNLAVQLLKPGVRHGRSNSDVGQNATQQPPSPRASLNIPRSGRSSPPPSSFHGSSLRSPSPNGSASTHLTTPSSSTVFGNSSRPTTPSPSVSRSSASGHGSSRSGFRVETTYPAASPSARSNCKGKEREKEKDEMPEPQESDLIRHYTMQNAESGLGKDYLKRQHVIRVRLEGEQFLLQGKDVESVIAWIEGLQSATNIALDLDERPMPAGPIFPRRRRRRRAVGVAAAAAASSEPTSATQLVAPLNRSRRV